MKKYLLGIAVSIVIGAIVIMAFFYLYRHKGNAQNPSFSSKALPSQITALVKKAEDLETHGDLMATKQTYQKIVSDYQGEEDLKEIHDRISSLNIKILFSSTPTPDSQLYEVAPGDSLEKIAKKFNTTTELIRQANNLSQDLIKPGRKLKVQNSTFSIVVDKSQDSLTLLSNGEVIKIYTVSTGKGNSTPTGTFKIINKLVNPPWYSAKGMIPPASPENVLGTRWLGIDRPGYGIHGTTDPKSIGFQCTEGCVRMQNREVEELYAIVPTGSEVTIID